MRKSILIALAVVLLMGATPALAELNGDWAGTGRGACSPPVGPDDFPIYAWQSWKGVIEDSEDEDIKVFYGKWEDKTGNYGNFKGKIIWMSQTNAYCEGKWTWYDTSVLPHKEIVMGKFSMKFTHFPVETPYCSGEWVSEYSNEGGTMKGKMIF
jgi:hypothetical protein